MKRAIQFMLPLLALLLLQACSTPTELITRWHESDYAGPPLQKLLVLGDMKKTGLLK